jgi:CHAD domain-containing protein
MAYRFHERDTTVADGFRRIAIEQIDKAIGEIDDDALRLPEKVHQVRKRCKKLRGLIRLVRPVFGGYGTENAAFRDAARALSGVRDSDVFIETYDDLTKIYEAQIERRAFAPIRRHLTLSKQRAETAVVDDARLKTFRAAIKSARSRAHCWRLEADGFDAIGGGVTKTYRRARKAMARAAEVRTAEAFHAWRKRMKYHWYHARLLTPIWPAVLKPHRAAAKRLSDALGDHHDLAVFRQRLADGPDPVAGKTAEVLVGLMDQRQAVLEAEAFALGERVLAEPPKALSARWTAYWNAWRRGLPPEAAVRSA